MYYFVENQTWCLKNRNWDKYTLFLEMSMTLFLVGLYHAECMNRVRSFTRLEICLSAVHLRLEILIIIHIYLSVWDSLPECFSLNFCSLLVKNSSYSVAVHHRVSISCVSPCISWLVLFEFCYHSEHSLIFWLSPGLHQHWESRS